MKTGYWIVAIGLAAFLGSTAQAQTTTVNYANTSNCYIFFDGAGRFSFTSGVNNLVITSGSAAGFSAQLSGTYTIGPVTTSGSVSSASVSGSGTLTIFDGTETFTATLTWPDIQQVGTSGSHNISGGVNLTTISYKGTNPDLRALATAGSASNVLTFQLVPGISLSALKSGAAPYQSSFSGSFSQ